LRTAAATNLERFNPLSSTTLQKLGLCLTETSIDAASIVVTPTSYNVQLLRLKMLTRMMTRLAILPLLALAASPTPGVVEFTRMWVSSDGETHLQDCTMQNMTKVPLPGGENAQFVRDLDGVVEPTQLIFTQMAADSTNPWHQCPTAQFVVVLAGSWFVNTNDGASKVMEPGHVLYQDDYVGLTVNGTSPVHFSAAAEAGTPCNQLIVSAATRTAAIDDHSCDWAAQFAAA